MSNDMNKLHTSPLDDCPESKIFTDRNYVAKKALRLSEKEIIEAWRQGSGPVSINKYLDPDIRCEKIIGIEFRLDEKGNSYISSVMLIDKYGFKYVADPNRLYLGEPIKKAVGISEK